ncbi:MAG: M16 family metallopeptidase [Thermoguttaceae bacterium]
MICLMTGFALLFFAASASAENIFPYGSQTHTLPNGLRVIFIPMSGSGLVSYWSIVRTGSRDEVEPGRSGYAHFFEHMMFRGTRKYPGPVYDCIVNGIGADSNAFTTDDFTAFHMTFAKEDLARVIELEADRFQNLHYERPAFQTEAGAVYGEYRKDQTEPEFMLDEKLRDTAFDEHTYKHTTMGFEADVKNMPQGYEYSQTFFQRFYRPENVVLLIVGDFDRAAALKRIEEYYGPWKPGYKPAQIKPEPAPSGERKTEVAYPGQTLPILDLAYRGDGFDPDNRDYAAARLLAELAFGSTSDAYKKLVLEQQNAETIFARVPMNRDPSLFEVTAVVKRPKDLPVVQKVLEAAIKRFQTEPVGAQHLAKVKRNEKYGFLMQLDSPLHTAEAVVPFISAAGSIDAVDRLFKASEQVTPEDIQRAARKYFTPQRRTVIVLKGAQK